MLHPKHLSASVLQLYVTIVAYSGHAGVVVGLGGTAVAVLGGDPMLVQSFLVAWGGALTLNPPARGVAGQEQLHMLSAIDLPPLHLPARFGSLANLGRSDGGPAALGY